MFKDFHILIIEDEKKISEMIRLYLEREGFIVDAAYDGFHGLQMVRSQDVHLLILDLNLPIMSGEEVLAEIRKTSDLPVLLLTAKSDEKARIAGFVLGADDYISKPFSVNELVERVKAVLRRAYKAEFAGGTVIAFKELSIDDRNKRVALAEELIDLTANEYKLLFSMARHPHQVFTRDALAELVFGYDYEAQSRNMDTYIKNIRKKLKEDSKNPVYIITRFGLGYQFGGGSDEA